MLSITLQVALSDTQPQVKQAVLTCRRPFNPSHSVPAAIHCLSRLLRERSVRVLFQRVSGSVQLLAPLLRSNASSAAPNQQLLYEAGMCVWQLTFYEPAAEAMGSSGVVQGLVDMARQATKEKVRQFLLSTAKSFSFVYGTLVAGCVVMLLGCMSLGHQLAACCHAHSWASDAEVEAVITQALTVSQQLTSSSSLSSRACMCRKLHIVPCSILLCVLLCKTLCDM